MITEPLHISIGAEKMFTKEKLEEEIISFGAAHDTYLAGFMDGIDYEVARDRILAIGEALARIKNAEATVAKANKINAKNLKSYPGLLTEGDYV